MKSQSQFHLATCDPRTLGKAECNHVQGVSGAWLTSATPPQVPQVGQATDRGCSGRILDATSVAMRARLHRFADLPAHWTQPDMSEGAEYGSIDKGPDGLGPA